MKNILPLWLLLSLALSLSACQRDAAETQAEPPVVAEIAEQAPAAESAEDKFVWSPERFADIKIVRYQIPGFDQLSVKQKSLVYYLVQAGLAGRDMMWDQNYRHNLSVRRALEAAITSAKADKESADWQALMLYARKVFFASGIHHHYSGDKFAPEFSQEYLVALLAGVGTKLNADALQAMFNPEVDAKKITLDPTKDLVKDSAVNFYDPDITDAEVIAFYSAMSDPANATPISYGLNSKVIRQADGTLAEKVWYAGGMYGAAIKKIIGWLEKAVTVAENKPQGDALKLLIKYYQTGDLKIWDDYNIAWTAATEGDVDYIHSFIEVYQDPKGYKGSYESIVQIKDFEASQRMQVVAENGQWFEDNSSTDPAHKKDSVVGITYNVVNVAGEAGDASPSTPIGVNLPNANWIRAQHGSKSVSLGNIVNAYDKARSPGMLLEFAHDDEEVAFSKAHNELAGKMRTALHEVIGHASGKLEAGVGTPKETLKNYSSALEEARADLVALYFIMDPKVIEMGLVPSLEVGKAAYDSFILNGMMLQLRRIKPGKVIEQAHMRNRQMAAAWVFDKGQAENVISRVSRDGKTYFEINDYQKLRGLFGELLKEVQRIKSQGDFAAGRDLIENYGVQVDTALHQEVLDRSAKLDIPPYGGFINPRLVPLTNDAGEITDIQVEYPDDFVKQMLEYGKNYSYLPDYN